MKAAAGPAIPEALVQTLVQARRVAVLTGAGISAESGVPTFRDAQTGLWAKYNPEDLATPEAFQRDPKLVWEWYQWRRGLVAKAAPNPGHLALAELERQVPEFTLITQNVDGLHRRAGSRNVLELHGNITRSKCFDCGAPLEPALLPPRAEAKEREGPGGREIHSPLSRGEGPGDGGKHSPPPRGEGPGAGGTHSPLPRGEGPGERVSWERAAAAPAATPLPTIPPPRCPHCGGRLRPDVVWFGEMLPAQALQRATEAARDCDVFLSVGTSTLVYPAAGLPEIALQARAAVTEVNPAPTPLSVRVRWSLRGPAGQMLPAVVDALRRTRG